MFMIKYIECNPQVEVEVDCKTYLDLCMLRKLRLSVSFNHLNERPNESK